MNEILQTVKEVQECGKYKANFYLEHGYLLLDIQTGARSSKFNANSTDGNAQQYYVRRNPVYVLGRPEGVEPVTAPEREEATGESKKA